MNIQPAAILQKMRRYCALRERSVKEVTKKLAQSGAPEDSISDMLEKLKNEGFVNERRYALAYASGKFRNNKWGKIKIELELKKQGIPESLIELGLNEISEEDYHNTLDDLLKKKWKQLKLADNSKITGSFSQRDPFGFTPEMQKLIHYALHKGFEYEVILERIKRGAIKG